jgi:hypothetical protein
LVIRGPHAGVGSEAEHVVFGGFAEVEQVMVPASPARSVVSSNPATAAAVISAISE